MSLRPKRDISSVSAPSSRSVRFRATPDTATGRLAALVDLTGFSSWARAAHPARVAFGPDRRLESVTSSLILGTTFTLQFGRAS